MSKPSQIAEVDELLSHLLDGGELSRPYNERLQTLLLEDQELLDQFVITTALANDLHHVASLAVSADGESEYAASTPYLTALGQLTRGLRMAVLALAASIAFVGLSIGLLWPQRVADLPATVLKPEFVATVVSQDGWAQRATYPVGSRIPTGKFALDEGVVQLQLDSGPNLLLEGPARIDIKSVSEAHLAFGKLVFRDDSGGDPFRLSTPWSALADLGTEYAVSVRRDDEEVHVFSGAVERTGISESGDAPIELLRDGQAMRYKRDIAGPAKPLATDPEKFVRKIAHDRSASERPCLVYEAFDYRSETAMIRGGVDGGQGWKGRWRRSILNKPGQSEGDKALPVGESLLFGSKPAASLGGSLGYVGHVLTHRNLAEPIDLSANKVFYLSFLYRPTGMWKQGENSLKVMFYNPNEGSIEHRIAIAMDAGRGLVRGALCGSRAECPLPMADGSTYLVAAKIACSADNPDQLMLRIFQPDEPVSIYEPASWSIVTPTVDSHDSYLLMNVHFECSHEQRIDEIRLGATWASVMDRWASSSEPLLLEPVAAVGE